MTAAAAAAATSYDAIEWEPSPSSPTEADMRLIHKMQQEELDRERLQRIQMEQDRRVAMQEQQKEHAAWEAIQEREQEARQRQVEADRVAAERVVVQERWSHHDQSQPAPSRETRDPREHRESRDSREEKQRERQVGRERKARRLQWENKAGLWNPGGYFQSQDLAPLDDGPTPGPSNFPMDSQQQQQQHSPVDVRYDHTLAYNHPFAASATPSHRPMTVHETRRDPFFSSTDPNDPSTSGVYDGMHSQSPRLPHSPLLHGSGTHSPLPPGASYGYHGEPSQSYYDSRDMSSHHFPSTASVRNNRSMASGHPPQSLVTPAPVSPDSIYRDDLSRVRSSDGGLMYTAQRPVPELEFPEPRPTYGYPRGDRHERRSSEGEVAPAYFPTSPQPDHNLDDSTSTARGHEWTARLRSMMDTEAASAAGTLMPTAAEDEGTLVPRPRVDTRDESLGHTADEDDEEQPEETLFFVPLGNDTGTQGPAKNDATMKPTLKVDTTSRTGPPSPTTVKRTTSSGGTATPAGGPHSSNSSSDLPPNTTSTMDSDVQQDSAGGSGGAHLKRAKSFAKTRDQWNFRPPAEDVYDRLEEFFPKIDLDKPVVETSLEPPATSTVAPAKSSRPPRQPGFNRPDARKSIRFVAEGRKKHLSRLEPTAAATPPDAASTLTKSPSGGSHGAVSLERKRSSSMWGHKVVEVTPAGIEQGKVVPVTAGEDTAPDEDPGRSCAIFNRFLMLYANISPFQ